MTESHKNILQEYFQKNKLPLPVYNCININSDKTNPVWKASVFCFNLEFTGVGNTKRTAEGLAAKNACNHFLMTKPITKPDAPTKQKVKSLSDIKFNDYNTILLVDGENCDVNINKIGKDILILIFVSKNTTKKLVFQLQNEEDNCYVFISERVGPDAADHLLTFYAGKLSVLYPDKSYYIFTKDHYGEYLETFMDNCKFICSLDNL